MAPTVGISLYCPRCDRQSGTSGETHCFEHKSPVTLHLRVDAPTVREHFDPSEKTRRDIWRYRELFPVEATDPVTLGEGWTDLVGIERVGDRLDVDLAAKLEGANPTGSTKDRGSSVLVTVARERGDDTVACASTGNAAASVAAYAARGNKSCSLFIPENLPETKAVQPLVYGADVIRVDGTYEQAYRACRKRVREMEWLDRSAGSTPHVPAGERTLGYELAEQTGSTPDWVVVPMGNGGTLGSAFEGWRTFERLDYTDGIPRFLGVQSRHASTIHDSLHDETNAIREGEIEEGSTCADSIDVETPHRESMARNAIEESNGATVTVGDAAIERWTHELGRTEGIFAEPASAATLAGLEVARNRGVVDVGERVIAVITGNGLKDTETALNSTPEA